MDKQVSEKAENPREGNIPLELNNSMKSSETRSTQSNTASEDEAEALLHESSHYDHNRPDRLPIDILYILKPLRFRLMLLREDWI